MLYSFDASHAKEYGVDEAIMLHNILFWIAKNKANNSNFHKGKFWTYNSAKAFSDLFPFWSARKIARVLSSLEKQGAIESDCFNKKGYDRTKWYSSPLLDSFTKIVQSNDQKCQMHLTKMTNGLTNFVQPIPDSKPYRKPDNVLVEKNCEEKQRKLIFKANKGYFNECDFNQLWSKFVWVCEQNRVAFTETRWNTFTKKK
jgi:hypothetical protein